MPNLNHLYLTSSMLNGTQPNWILSSRKTNYPYPSFCKTRILGSFLQPFCWTLGYVHLSNKGTWSRGILSTTNNLIPSF
ncbi:uncharacterized protein [Elaeis guineensis]